jgi:hypothetical protein
MQKIPIELELIKKQTEYLFNLEDISKKTRKRDYVVARYIYYKLSVIFARKRYLDISLLVKQDHSTVNNGLKKIEGYLRDYKKYRDIYDDLYGFFYRGMDESDIYDMVKLRNIALKQEEEIKLLKENHIKPTLKPIVKILNEVPEHHLDLIKMRLEPIVRMLPKQYIKP